VAGAGAIAGAWAVTAGWVAQLASAKAPSETDAAKSFKAILLVDSDDRVI